MNLSSRLSAVEKQLQPPGAVEMVWLWLGGPGPAISGGPAVFNLTVPVEPDEFPEGFSFIYRTENDTPQPDVEDGPAYGPNGDLSPEDEDEIRRDILGRLTPRQRSLVERAANVIANAGGSHP